jgi:hypothetical protein
LLFFPSLYWVAAWFGLLLGPSTRVVDGSGHRVGSPPPILIYSMATPSVLSFWLVLLFFLAGGETALVRY